MNCSLQLLLCSSTIALLHKISKDCEDANTVLKLVQDWESNAGEKRPRSTGDSSSFLSKGSKYVFLKKYNQVLNEILLDVITFADQEFWKRHNQVQI